MVIGRGRTGHGDGGLSKGRVEGETGHGSRVVMESCNLDVLYLVVERLLL